MKKLRGILAVCVLYLLSFASASAHVKWFVEEEKIEPIPWYALTDKPVVVWYMVVLCMVVLGAYLDRIIKTPRWLTLYDKTHEYGIHRVAEALLGIFLIVTVDFFWNTIITPYVDVGEMARVMISGLQLALGVLFISGLYIRVASSLLFLLCIAMGLWSGPVVFFENLLLLSMSVYLFLETFKKGVLPDWLFRHKRDILRVGSGICLVVLAFTEKLLYPEFSLAFLEAHPWNFIKPVFPNFSDALFILSVGMSELLFGILFTLGYLTRITTLALSACLVSSATAMYFSIGDWEPGHVVIYAVAIIFVFYGSDKIKERA
ncbi:MAG: hypothetical protein ACKOW9_01040 [Candidatus Paceibacterota bacterium]